MGFGRGQSVFEEIDGLVVRMHANGPEQGYTVVPESGLNLQGQTVRYSRVGTRLAGVVDAATVPPVTVPPAEGPAAAARQQQLHALVNGSDVWEQ